ncbi:MAG: dihydrofolate reductase family protein [Actinomycetota bacterium]|jgi:dihydrofolate reductase|nr:dihydrofolate reductase family protein [Actinomycetota bacterium]
MQLILSDFMSLDGVVQAPGGREEDTDGAFTHGGWSMPYFDPETMGPVIGEMMAITEALLFGRRTWQTMAAAWPGRAGDPFADRMNEIPKYVASRTLIQDDLTWWNSTLLPADDAIGAVRELRARDGASLQVMGSSSLAAQLIEHDLVDEYRLMIEPILLGGGKRLFPYDGQARPLELVSTTTTRTGVVMCTYRPAGHRPT